MFGTWWSSAGMFFHLISISFSSQPHTKILCLLSQALETEWERQDEDMAAGVEIQVLCSPAKSSIYFGSTLFVLNLRLNGWMS